MAKPDSSLADLHRLLVEALRERDPAALRRPFTVAEIYQDLVPYRQYRDELDLDMNGDYEHLLLRLLAGEGKLVTVESEAALRDLRRELEQKNPNTGLYREYAAVDVRLVEAQIPDDYLAGQPVEGETDTGAQEPGLDLLRTDVADVEGGPARKRGRGGGEPRAGMASERSIDDAARGVREADEVAGAEPAPDPTDCTWCGRGLPKGKAALRFCPHCGRDVREVPCPGCGETLEVGWRFCIACGEEVGQP